MLSKSKRDLLNQLKDMSGEEVFRAWLEAIKREEKDMATTIQRFASSDTVKEAESLSIHYIVKTLLIHHILLNKALLAINFYNSFSINLGSPSEFKTELNSENMTAILEKIANYQEDLSFIDEQTENKLKLEEFSELNNLYKVFDFWKTIEPHLEEQVRQMSESRKGNDGT